MKQLQCSGGMMLAVGLLGLMACPLQSAADFNLKLSIVVKSASGYVEPENGKFAVTSQPTSFTVQVHNNSKLPQQIFTDQVSGVLSKLRFELTDARGENRLVSKKTPLGARTVWGTRSLAPGEMLAGDVLITPEEWDNVIVVPPGEVRQFTVRAVYENGSETVYSDRYEVTIAPPAAPAATADEP
ncbi:MAG: hypothetical protein O3B24_00625 [Verrucomicrobia bacterium]|nr:hypothetical protein [Verrucomicrobiota bacterium]